MENSWSYKWVVILFFGIVGIMFTASIFYLVTGNVAPDSFFGRQWKLPKTEDSPKLLSADKYVLERDQGMPIDNRIFFYKGRQGNRIRFDVIIPELDRQYPYTFTVDLKKTKNGFEVAGIWLQLIAVRDNFLSLKKMS